VSADEERARSRLIAIRRRNSSPASLSDLLNLADVGESVTIACQNLPTNLFSPVTADCRQP
jgi:hypothetical protein